MREQFSIQDLAHLSGVKAHTIRIWEQRYNLLNPERTSSNIRIYSNDDLRLLLNVSVLRNNGMKISKIASMSEVEIAGTAIELSRVPVDSKSAIDVMVSQAMALDEFGLERAIESEVLKRGVESTMKEIVFPFMERIGTLWATGTIKPGHEHFVSSIIRRKLISAVEGQMKEPAPDAKTFMLFLPDGELHELSLIFLQYLLKARCQRVIYLGASMPLDHLTELVGSRKVDWLYGIFTSPANRIGIDDYLIKLSESLPSQKIVISGRGVHELQNKPPEHVKVLRRVEEIMEFINSFSTQ